MFAGVREQIVHRLFRARSSHVPIEFFSKYSLCHILPEMLRQHFIDQRLIPDLPASGFLPKLVEHAGIDANGNEPTRFVAEWRPTNPPHYPQLLR